MNSSNNNKVVTQNWNGRSGNCVGGYMAMGVGNWHRQPNKMCQVSAMLQLEFMQSAPVEERARWIENRSKREKEEMFQDYFVISIELCKFSSTNWNYNAKL